MKAQSLLLFRSDFSEQSRWNNSEIHLSRMKLERNLIEVNHKNNSSLSPADLRKSKGDIKPARGFQKMLKSTRVCGFIAF
jgi:hypothetical protein